MHTKIPADLFPAYMDWPQAVADVGLVSKDISELRLVTKAKGLEKLGQLTRLERLWCFDINEISIRDICRTSGLKFLFIENYKVDNFDCLKELKQLNTLALESCSKIDSLRDLATFGNLTGLRITHFKNVHDLSPLSGLTNLRQLAVDGSMWTAMKVKTLQPLASLTKLEYLSLTNLRVEDKSLQPLGELTNLKRLDIANFYPLEEIAWLSGRLQTTECTWFTPYIELRSSNCKRCGNRTVVLLSGRGTKLICKVCDSDKLGKHVSLFSKFANR